MYTPEHLARWTLPRCYAGAKWPEYFSAGVGRSRDSEALEEANFQAVEAALEATPEPEDWALDEAPWLVVRETHWAVGWVEWIAIHEGAADHLAVADEIKGRLDDYPVVDEELWSEIEDEHCRLTWDGCFNRKERVQYFRDHSFTGSVPDLLQACRGSWYHAANLLHCPSDILG